MIKQILPILFIFFFLVIPASAANEPENLTADWDQTFVILDWDDVPSATQYNISRYLPAMLWTDTPPTLDGVIDQVYINDSHRAVQFSPNPPYANAYDTFYILRNDTYVYLASDTRDDDILTDDDWAGVYVDYDRDGLTNAVDVHYRIVEDGTILRERWSGSAWSTWAGSAATAAVTGAGTSHPIYELFIPMSELDGFTNESIHDILIERSSQELPEPRIYKYQPTAGLPTTTDDWTFLYITNESGQEYFNLFNTTESTYTLTGLDPFDWYKFGVSSLVAGETSNNTIISGITTQTRWFVSGHVYDEASGEPVRNGVIYATDTVTTCVDETNNTGYYHLCGLVNDSYTITAVKDGYTTATEGVVIAGENETVDVFMSTMGGNKIPLMLFIFIAIIDIGCIAMAFINYEESGITQIFASFMATIISYMLSKMVINGQLVESFEFASVIQNAAIGYLFTYVAIIMVIITMIRVVLYANERYQESEF